MIELDDLRDEQRGIAQAIGIEAYLTLSRTYGGMTIYIAKAEDIMERKRRDERIREEYDGTNITRLARKYGLTETWIRNIVSEKAKEIKASPIPGQMNLMEFIGE